MKTIKVDTAILDAQARALRALAQDMQTTASQLSGMYVPGSAGGHLPVSISTHLPSLRRRAGGATAGESIRSHGQALDELASVMHSLARKLEQASGRFQETEAALVARAIEIAEGISGLAGGIIRTPPPHHPPTPAQIHDRAVRDRIDGADPEVRALYEKYIEKIKFADDNYRPPQKAFYNPLLNHIKYNKAYDATNEQGPGATYFHEIGHAIDDQSTFFGNATTYGGFKDSLHADFDNYVQKVMRENNLGSVDAAYDHIGDWLWADPNMRSSVSDLIGGLTGNECIGKWGHETGYWKNEIAFVQVDSGKLQKEAFAHFFEASMSNDPARLNVMKEVFPSAYQEFQKMVRNMI